MARVRIYCGLASAHPPRQLAVGSASLCATIVDDSGRVLDLCDIGDDSYGYAYLSTLLAERATGPYSVAIATDGDQRLVTRLLITAGWTVAVVDPESTDDYTERFADPLAESTGSAPTQRRALGLARALQAGVVAATLLPAAPELHELRPVLAAHHALANGRQSAAVALRELLRELYPAALRAYADPADPVALAVIEALPEPGALSPGRGREPLDAVTHRLTEAGVGDQTAVTEAITALRVAVAETPRRGGISRSLTPTVAEAVRRAATAVRGYDAASSALVAALAERAADPAAAGAAPAAEPRVAPAGAPVQAGPGRVPHPRPPAADDQPVPASYPTAAPGIPQASPGTPQPSPGTDRPVPTGAGAGSAAADTSGTAHGTGLEQWPTSGQRRAATSPPAPTERSAPAHRPAPPPQAAPDHRPADAPVPAGSLAPTPEPPPSAPPAREPIAPLTPAASAAPHAPSLDDDAGYGGRRNADVRAAEPRSRSRAAGSWSADSGSAEPGYRAHNRPVSPPPPPPPGITPIQEPSRVSARKRARQGTDQPVSPAADPPTGSGYLPPGSRASWPTTPPADDWAASGPVSSNGHDRQAPTPPVEPSRNGSASGGASSSARPGAVTPPWQDDALRPPEPPVLRLVDHADPLNGGRGRDSAQPEPPPLRLVSPTNAGAGGPSPGRPRSAPPVSAAADDDDLLIFSQTRSAWFDQEHDGHWSSAMDLGWQAAEQASAQPVVGDRTGAGLPRRVPHANLVPGAPPRQEDRPLRVVRDAAAIAAHTSGYFSGWRRGQEVGGFPVGTRHNRRAAGAWEFHRDEDRLSG